MRQVGFSQRCLTMQLCLNWGANGAFGFLVNKSLIRGAPNAGLGATILAVLRVLFAVSSGNLKFVILGHRMGSRIEIRANRGGSETNARLRARHF